MFLRLLSTPSAAVRIPLGDADVPDFEILFVLVVDGAVVFTGENRPHCRRWPVLGHSNTAGCQPATGTPKAKLSLSPLWHVISVNGNPAIVGKSIKPTIA